jgi:hypothetical protein
MTDDWTDQLAGARMQVDQQYQETLDASDFSNQEWGLVMTAVDWEIENPEDPENATLIADKSKLPDIVPELRNIQQEMGGSSTPVDEGPDTRGFLGRIKQYIHHLQAGTDGSSEKKIADAKELVEGYTRALQEYLEERGRWEDICAAAVRHRQS